MLQRSLRALQVAALLVSASYGIGFLFGSGEMALTHGMGGSLYGLATAFGMLLLAGFAAPLWRQGVAVWDLFGQAYGPALRNCVALLSVVWMAGVLAAQIHGGVAILRLLGVREWTAFALVLVGVLVASRLHLVMASKVFAVFLLGSAAVLLHVLLTGSGGAIYVQSPALLLRDLGTFRAGTLASITIAVVALVCTGSDYHQFLLAARRPVDATLGCLLAAGILAIFSFVPAAVVLGLRQDGGLAGLADSKQVIPMALTHAAARLGMPVLGPVFLIGLLGAALGSGAAVLRAMASALIAATAGKTTERQLWPSIAALVLGGALALRGQGIVATMVSVNILYIASIAVPFACLLAGRPLSTRSAMGAMGGGLLAALLVYVLGWRNTPGIDEDLRSLLAGLGASAVVPALVRLLLHRPAGRRV